MTTKATIDSYNAQELRRCLHLDDTEPLPESLIVYTGRIIKALRNYGRSGLTVDNYAVLVGNWQALEALREAAGIADPYAVPVVEEVTLLGANGEEEGVAEVVERKDNGWLRVKKPDGSFENRRAATVRVHAEAGA